LSKLSVRPWLCAGDYNEILHSYEKEEITPRPNEQIEEICNCLEHYELQDMGFRGFPVTWCNDSEIPQTVEARLDRACCNSRWAAIFPVARVLHGQVAVLDHLLVWVDLEPLTDYNQKKRPRPFTLKQLGQRIKSVLR
ncbi:UNVERIFIED_CONTAM: hypothetical protein Slati_0204200, partial [Sesamum latifolium]